MIRTIYEDNNAELETYLSENGISISIKQTDMEFPIEITLDAYEVFDLADKLNAYANELVSKKNINKDLVN
jgi:hypothetical protein